MRYGMMGDFRSVDVVLPWFGSGLLTPIPIGSIFWRRSRASMK
jgi:hypothetical protein